MNHFLQAITIKPTSFVPLPGSNVKNNTSPLPGSNYGENNESYWNMNQMKTNESNV